MPKENNSQYSREPNSDEKQRIQLFEDKRIRHSLLNKAMLKVSRGMYFPKGASTIYLYGPSGVGKTTLLQSIAETINQTDLLYLLVKSPETAFFSWFDFQRRLLMEIDSRITDGAISYEEMNIRRRGDGTLRIESKHNTISDLRLAVIKAMKHARVSKYIFDEVPHIKKGRSQYRISDQMDALKSFIDDAGEELKKVDITPVFVLAGTYELLEMMSLNGQLGRRSIKVPFRQYSLASKADIRIFTGVITNLQNAMDLTIKPDLASRLEYLYVASCGCVGILKQWLNRAYRDAVMGGAKTITDKHLKNNAPHKADIQRLSHEIAEGERTLKKLEGDLSTIYLNLGVPSEYIPNANSFLNSTTSDVEGEGDE